MQDSLTEDDKTLLENYGFEAYNGEYGYLLNCNPTYPTSASCSSNLHAIKFMGRNKDENFIAYDVSSESFIHVSKYFVESVQTDRNPLIYKGLRPLIERLFPNPFYERRVNGVSIESLDKRVTAIEDKDKNIQEYAKSLQQKHEEAIKDYKYMLENNLSYRDLIWFKRFTQTIEKLLEEFETKFAIKIEHEKIDSIKTVWCGDYMRRE